MEPASTQQEDFRSRFIFEDIGQRKDDWVVPDDQWYDPGTRDDGKPETQEERVSRYAPPKYIIAQLASNRPAHLPQHAIDMLPYAPQYGDYFGAKLLTMRALRHCEKVQKLKSGRILQIPLKDQLPPEQPIVTSSSQPVDFA